MTEDQIVRLRAVQDMVRLLLGNADAAEADAVIKAYADAVAGTKLT